MINYFSTNNVNAPPPPHISRVVTMHRDTWAGDMRIVSRPKYRDTYRDTYHVSWPVYRDTYHDATSTSGAWRYVNAALQRMYHNTNVHTTTGTVRQLGDLFKNNQARILWHGAICSPWMPSGAPAATSKHMQSASRGRRRFGFTTAMNESLISSLFRVPRHFVDILFDVTSGPTYTICMI